MSYKNLLRLFAPLALVVFAAAPMVAQTRVDQPLRDTLTAGFRNAATEHRVNADLSSLGLASTPSLLAGAVAVPVENGVEGALRGEPFGLAYLDGRDATVAPGYYRLAVDRDGAAVLLDTTGGTAATGHASFDLTAGDQGGTHGCWIDVPNPNDDDIVCIKCVFGNPNWPGGAWGFNTCLTIFDPFDND
jgi:hypothetical protein